jgi:hypothetical protein
MLSGEFGLRLKKVASKDSVKWMEVYRGTGELKAPP